MSRGRSAYLAVGERKYTELKVLGDGSFGTVWLCDWHSPVKSDTLLSAMQCGAGARPEWAGKRLVALKRMKRVWEGGWKQASTLGEIVVSRADGVSHQDHQSDLLDSRCAAYHHIQPSSHYTTHSFRPNRTNCTSCSSAWKATFTNSRSLDEDDRLLPVSSLPVSIRSPQVCTTSTSTATSTAT